jgi:hypothetical protein
MQVANGCFYSIKSIFFWVCNGNIAAMLKGGGKGGGDQGAGGHDNEYSMVAEFWEGNVFLFLSILNLLVCLEVLKVALETC